jgi:rsbT co-antagonist protein RsbR
MAITRMRRTDRKDGAAQQKGPLSRLDFDDREIQSRRRFFELTDEDLERLKSLRGFAQKYTQEITEALYELILAHPETKAFFPDETTVQHVKKMQNAYFLELFSGRCDGDYVENRFRVGATHERIGMPPKWYLGAYRRYLDLIRSFLVQEFKGDPERIEQATRSIMKIIFFDMTIAIDTYISAHVETVTRHRQAIRELSTPAIRVFDGIILLPLIGTLDTQRAQQVLETILKRVIEEKAKVLILDIAGVPVVDTKVADHLIRATAAARLLGAQTILTGLSAQIAETIVLLGVDVSSMHTRTHLSEGIELALQMQGKAIRSAASAGEAA